MSFATLLKDHMLLPWAVQNVDERLKNVLPLSALVVPRI
jgi:hypothetical protein